ncbi:MAG: TRAP transporter large permease subunit, partial [Pseudomonadota bacterium]
MTDATWITMISLGVTFLFMLGVPVFLVIAYWVVGCSFVLGMTLDNIGAALSDVFTDGFALLAMPLFILTGDLINKSGIARRLSDFAYACLGWVRGGLAMASIGACGLFAAISGSNSATTATIGSMLHPEMVKGGYDERFSAATAAAGGTVGIIIPPSIIFIVYGFLMNLPISDLFVAGIIPGALMVFAMQFACWIICLRNGWGYLIPLQLARVMKTALGAWLGFFAIGLVLWGIYTGKFSPTEAAGVTVGFCVIVGLI